MGGHFNELSPAEAERLALLAEECGEVIQAIGKVLRHGYESVNPAAKASNETNREMLARELGDHRAAVRLMPDAGDFSEGNIDHAARHFHPKIAMPDTRPTNPKRKAEIEDALAEMRRSMKRWPGCGVVAGVVNIPDHCNSADVWIGTVDFTGVHYAALADASLERAIERMSAMTPPPLDLIASCVRARALLDFEELKPNA